MPTISILTTTFNRKELIKRAIDSVLGQTYNDFEYIIIDDHSTDGTQEEIRELYPDPRIRYFYNEQNQGAEHGDRIHIKRFVHELARGKYFLYLCSDDYLMVPTLLAWQMAMFQMHPTAAMVTGGQKGHDGVFPPGFSTSDRFLEHFSNYPITSNIIVGATLFNRDIFIQSGALQTEGSRWQAGYELFMGPGCYGDFVYINQPCIYTEITPQNASFNGTQKSHFLDSVKSVKTAFIKPMLDFPNRGLEKTRNRTINNIAKTYLSNAEHIKSGKPLTMCSAENVKEPVTVQDVISVLADL